MSKSKIEWTEETWNPVTGCTKISTGCQNCYAERMAHRLAGRFGYPPAPNQFNVTLHHDRLDDPFHWKKPRKVFVCSMGDLFHEDVPADFIIYVFQIMALAKHHTFQVLTKRPERMMSVLYGEEGGFYLGGGDFIPNVWLGVTAENQQAADERIPWLLKTPAAVRFVSVEPMLGPVSFHWAKWMPVRDHNHLDGLRCLDWVICGGETGPGARPMDWYWAKKLEKQCLEADVPFFFKKIGDAADVYLKLIKGTFPRQWPKVVTDA